MARPRGCRRERERERKGGGERRREEGGKLVLGVACPPPLVPPAGVGPSNANTRARTPANTYTRAPSGAHALRLRQTRAAAASLDSWTPESRDPPAADATLPVPIPTLQFLQDVSCRRRYLARLPGRSWLAGHRRAVPSSPPRYLRRRSCLGLTPVPELRRLSGTNFADRLSRGGHPGCPARPGGHRAFGL